ncbi:MAG: hypothetical protein U9R29_05905 [Thermodesulfobacteriota bacterium]|nr:hypothetical protein [Thermodesulfobacteriota bacterium]
MKAIKNIILSLLMTLVVASPALATTAGRADYSSLVVVAFLAICAAIIGAQVAPAIMTFLGIKK